MGLNDLTIKNYCPDASIISLIEELYTNSDGEIDLELMAYDIAHLMISYNPSDWDLDDWSVVKDTLLEVQSEISKEQEALLKEEDTDVPDLSGQGNSFGIGLGLNW